MSNGTAFELRINGFPATEIAAHSAPTIETAADGGIEKVSFGLALTARSQHQAVRTNALVEVMVCGFTIASALLDEPDRTTWECHASGLASSLRRTIALDSAGSATRDIQVALAQAIADGSRVLNPAPITGTGLAGGGDGNPDMIGTLLDQYAEQTGQRWGVDGSRRLFMRADPVAPTWMATPDAAAFGVANEGAPTRRIGRYNAGGGLYDTAKVGVLGSDEIDNDLPDRGPITPVAAEAILAGRLLRRGQISWTNGVTLSRREITTIGGTPAFLASVVAGQTMRAHGLASSVISQAPWLDVTIGRTKYTVGEDVIYLEPVNTVPRTAEAVWAS